MTIARMTYNMYVCTTYVCMYKVDYRGAAAPKNRRSFMKANSPASKFEKIFCALIGNYTQ